MSKYKVGYDIKDVRKPLDLGKIVVWLLVLLFLLAAFIAMASIKGPVCFEYKGGICV